MERLNSIKERLRRNKKWQTQTENGYIHSVVGEYKHEDVQWLIEQAEKVEKLEKRKEEILVESGKRWTKLIEIERILNKD